MYAELFEKYKLCQRTSTSVGGWVRKLCYYQNPADVPDRTALQLEKKGSDGLIADHTRLRCTLGRLGDKGDEIELSDHEGIEFDRRKDIEVGPQSK